MRTIAIAGLGAIGYAVAKGLDEGINGMRLNAVYARDSVMLQSRLHSLASMPKNVALEQLYEYADIVIECGGAELLRQLAPSVLRAGKQLLVLSAGVLIAAPELASLAQAHRSRILIPSGAIGALDAVAAMAQGAIHSARLITTKPSAALHDVAWLSDRGIDPALVRTRTLLFSGPVAEAVRYFPANLNVAAALSLAGIGAQKTMVELWLDPHARGNCHAIEVQSDSGTMRFSMEAIASANPGTSSLAAQSVLSLLRRMSSPLQVG